MNNISSMSEIIGNVDGKDCIIVDDIVDSASTVCMSTELLIEKGAASVRAIITHAVLSGDAITKIENSSLKNIYVSDSIYHEKLPDKFTVLPIYELIGKCFKHQFVNSRP